MFPTEQNGSSNSDPKKYNIDHLHKNVLQQYKSICENIEELVDGHRLEDLHPILQSIPVLELQHDSHWVSTTQLRIMN